MDFGKNRLKQLNRKLKKNPNSYEANVQLGLFYFKRGDIAIAITYLEKACDPKENRAEVLFVIANAYRTLNDISKSEAYFERALSLEPDNFDFLYNYGLLLYDSNRQKEAIKIFEKGSKIRPRNHELLNDIGVLYHQEKQFDKAIDFLKRALEVDQDYIVAGVNIGHAYLAANDISNAEKAIEKLSRFHPQNHEVIELRRQFDNVIENTSRNVAEVDTELSFSDQLFQITPLKIIDGFGEKKNAQEIGLSIVVPVLNERENIPILYGELKGVLENLKEGYEIIFVEDGSTDGSKQVLKDLADSDENIRVIQFRKTYGQTAALNAGFKYSHGGVVITLDGDLQNDPKDIPRLLEKMAEGYDLVSGWRKDRRDRWLSRGLPSMVANRIINKLIEGTGVQLHDFGCTLKAYKRGIVKNIHLYGEMHRFIPAFAAWLGVRVAEIPVNHRPRIHGTAKYNLSRVSRVVFDLLVVRFFSDYLTRPIQFFGKIAKKVAGFGLCGILLLGCLSLLTDLTVSLNTFVLLSALLIFAVLQIVSMGLLGEIMIRSYFEGQGKDCFVVEKIINDGYRA